MKYADDRTPVFEEANNRKSSAGSARMFLAAFLMLTASGCSYVPEWADPSDWMEEKFADNSAPPPKLETEGAQGMLETATGKPSAQILGRASDPILSAEDQANIVPPPSPLEERRKLVEGLASGQQQSRYSDEDLRPASDPMATAGQMITLPTRQAGVPDAAPTVPVASSNLSAPVLPTVKPPEVPKVKVPSTALSVVENTQILTKPKSALNVTPEPMPELQEPQEITVAAPRIDIPSIGSAPDIQSAPAVPVLPVLSAPPVASAPVTDYSAATAAPLPQRSASRTVLADTYGQLLQQSSSNSLANPESPPFVSSAAAPLPRDLVNTVSPGVLDSYNQGLQQYDSDTSTLLKSKAYSGGGAGESRGSAASTGSLASRMQFPADSSGASELNNRSVSGAGKFAGEIGSQSVSVGFGKGSDHVSGIARRKLASAVKQHRGNSQLVRIVGHASSRTRDLPPHEHALVNFKISLRRANAVAQELIRQGISADSIVVEARADTEPLALEVMPSTESKNRRVVVYFE